MQGFNPQASLLPQGSGTIQPMSGGGGAPFGFANAEQFEAQKSVLIQLSDSIKAAKDLKAFYEVLKTNPQKYSDCKQEMLTKVMAAGILSSIKVEPDNTISKSHFNDIYYVRLLFKNLMERNITIDDIDIRFTADDLEIVLHSTTDQVEAPAVAAATTAAATTDATTAATTGAATTDAAPAAAAAPATTTAAPATLAKAAAAAPKELGTAGKYRPSTAPSGT